MLDEEEEKAIESLLSEHFKQSITLRDHRSVGGGSINDAFKIATDKGTFFLKVNHASRYPGMFEAEAKGLELLRSAGEILVPEVIVYGEDDNDKAFLVLEYIESNGQRPKHSRELGTRLARLHMHSNDQFGLDHDNYIGSLPQRNTPKDNWADFFAEERLGYQIRMARDANKMGASDAREFEKLYGQLERIFPAEPPALLHGDLWAGNHMTGPQGEPCIMDPAVYYGHREMDIGMTRLFGGFDRAVYEAYNETYPMEEGWEERAELANLYPLLVHVNLFGGAYLMEARSILKRFV